MASPQHWTWDPDDEQDLVSTERALERLQYVRGRDREHARTIQAARDACVRALVRMRETKNELLGRLTA